MRARHTPGPWEVWEAVDSHEIRMGTGIFADGSYEAQHAIEYDHGLNPSDGEQWEEADANARLIAAAPEMLEVLTDLEWSGTTDLPGGGTGACCPECDGIAPDVRLPGWAQDYHGHAADCRILAVITRATGEEAPHG